MVVHSILKQPLRNSHNLLKQPLHIVHPIYYQLLKRNTSNYPSSPSPLSRSSPHSLSGSLRGASRTTLRLRQTLSLVATLLPLTMKTTTVAAAEASARVARSAKVARANKSAALWCRVPGAEDYMKLAGMGKRRKLRNELMRGKFSSWQF